MYREARWHRSTAAPDSPARGRRTPRASGDERERAILATAEQLLEERPLSEISVEDLAKGAGISRPSFYFYFASKDAVLLTLVDRMVERGRRSARGRARQDSRRTRGPACAWPCRPPSRPSAPAAPSPSPPPSCAANNAEARELWSQVMEGWVADATAVIEAERARGAAPAGPPARDLAIALIQMNERAHYATFAGEQPALADAQLLDVLVEIWLRAIYGADLDA